MQPYAVYINEAALGSVPRSGLQREKVMNFTRFLAENPNTTGGFFRARRRAQNRSGENHWPPCRDVLGRPRSFRNQSHAHQISGQVILPPGRPTLIEMNYRELEKKFGRTQ